MLRRNHKSQKDRKQTWKTMQIGVKRYIPTVEHCSLRTLGAWTPPLATGRQTSHISGAQALLKAIEHNTKTLFNPIFWPLMLSIHIQIVYMMS